MRIKDIPQAIESISIDQVSSIYSGKAGKCCCGCSGNHRYASKHVGAAGKHRGYKIQEEEISDRSVSRITNLVKNNRFSDTVDYGLPHGGFISVEIGERLYILYFHTEKK